MRVAIVHDFLVRMGGAEDVLAVFLELYPDADVFTAYMDPIAVQKKFPALRKITVHKGAQRMFRLLRHIPILKNISTKLFLHSMPRIVERWNLAGYDLVILNSGAWCHGVITSVDTKVFAYMHSPMRFAWDYTHAYRRDLGARPSSMWDTFLVRKMHPIRIWDAVSAKRNHTIVCNSHLVAKRINKFYRGQQATVIYPPVRTGAALPVTSNKEPYFLILSTLTKYKHIQDIIRFANTRHLPLTIAGDGPYRGVLEKMSGPSITFLGRITDEQKWQLLQKARAVIYPSLEDFGIVPVEAMAAGAPVIGLGHGGILETITPGKTGVFFADYTEDALAKAWEEFSLLEESYQPEQARTDAEQFRDQEFKKQIRALIKTSFSIKQLR